MTDLEDQEEEEKSGKLDIAEILIILSTAIHQMHYNYKRNCQQLPNAKHQTLSCRPKQKVTQDHAEGRSCDGLIKAAVVGPVNKCIRITTGRQAERIALPQKQ